MSSLFYLVAGVLICSLFFSCVSSPYEDPDWLASNVKWESISGDGETTGATNTEQNQEGERKHREILKRWSEKTPSYKDENVSVWANEEEGKTYRGDVLVFVETSKGKLFRISGESALVTDAIVEIGRVYKAEMGRMDIKIDPGQSFLFNRDLETFLTKGPGRAKIRISLP